MNLHDLITDALGEEIAKAEAATKQASNDLVAHAKANRDHQLYRFSIELHDGGADSGHRTTVYHSPRAETLEDAMVLAMALHATRQLRAAEFARLSVTVVLPNGSLVPVPPLGWDKLVQQYGRQAQSQTLRQAAAAIAARQAEDRGHNRRKPVPAQIPQKHSLTI